MSELGLTPVARTRLDLVPDADPGGVTRIEFVTGFVRKILVERGRAVS